MTDDIPTLRVTIETSRAVRLEDAGELLDSLEAALNQSAAVKGITNESVMLRTVSIKTGSLVADLLTIANAAMELYEHRALVSEILGIFIAQLDDALQMRLAAEQGLSLGLSRLTSRMAIPVYQDEAKRTSIQVIGDNNLIVIVEREQAQIISRSLDPSAFNLIPDRMPEAINFAFSIMINSVEPARASEIGSIMSAVNSAFQSLESCRRLVVPPELRIIKTHVEAGISVVEVGAYRRGKYEEFNEESLGGFWIYLEDTKNINERRGNIGYETSEFDQLVRTLSQNIIGGNIFEIRILKNNSDAPFIIDSRFSETIIPKLVSRNISSFTMRIGGHVLNKTYDGEVIWANEEWMILLDIMPDHPVALLCEESIKEQLQTGIRYRVFGSLNLSNSTANGQPVKSGLTAVDLAPLS